ncbi:PH domain-containing protein [Promicromonospora iranensis]|uniref:Membrane protein YdbS with pleckstrin-like domain n=1 Tax=Promicromonospora iranensis TaxID=1105144 RepID=A0ABU2CSQ2_9MICO|nr:PH domain-containing protein [Promicromonospora iranensis]MDR7384364.1 membrane protein YdbS with pleckstrin-like domain [Promicromonospora iranensis]
MSAPADFIVPHRALQRYILADEKIIVATHRHWGLLWEPILTTAGAFVLALALNVAVDPNVRDDMGWVWLPFLVLGARLFYKWLEWRARWFVMTDRRLLLLDGFLVHRVAMMPSEKVTDLGYERTPLGQLLGYGTFVFETAGQDQALDRVTWIPRPDARYRLIIASLFHPDAADAEAAAQAHPDMRPQAMPPADSSSGPPPPALMPRIGRRSNPPTQRIELPAGRGGGAPGGTADESDAGEGGEPTGPTWSSTGSGTAPATSGSAASPGRTSDGHHHGEHVPGGATAIPGPSEVLPEPFIEGGKDPKIR